jgi:hypothetical protein
MRRILATAVAVQTWAAMGCRAMNCLSGIAARAGGAGICSRFSTYAQPAARLFAVKSSLAWIE